jgi:hypothetical protein
MCDKNSFLAVIPFPFSYKSYNCVCVNSKELDYTIVILIVKCFLMCSDLLAGVL